MTETTQDLLARVLALPEADRRAVADALDVSLIDPDAPWADPEFRAEIERRANSVADGTTELLDGEQVFREALERLDGRRKPS